jgi:phosphoenolpyruvate-protein phosphotransferase (PTS system enzyme I)
MPKNVSKEIVLSGIGASPGICIGIAYLVDKEGVEVVQKYTIDPKDLDAEISRFKTAVKVVTDELHTIIENTPVAFREHAYILETHLVLLKDKMLYGKTIESIKRDRVNAEWALKDVVSSIKTVFQNISDPYIKERSEDIGQVSDRIMLCLAGVETIDISEINKRVILVAHELTPAETSQIQVDRIMGFITDRGGQASHTGIIARSLEIPAVMGLRQATRKIKNDDIVIVDGNAGIIIIGPSEKTLIEYEERKSRYEARQAAMTRDSHLPAVTADGFKLVAMGNIELPEEIVSVLDHGGDGIGLYRTEFQYLNRSDFPTEDELFEKYKEVVEVVAPKSVTIRTLDINGDKALDFENGNREENPALGLRAIRYCLKRPEVFETQLRAILRAAVYGNVRIMFPMISSCDEVSEAKRMLAKAATQLANKGVAYKKEIDIGILIEVPSAVVMADAMADMVDFFSIGTNDLIQYALAIDRGNQEVAHLYQPLHPAIIRMLKHIADVAREKNVRVAMCGEMAGDPFHIPVLLGMGINELSMNPQAIPAVKNTIRSLRLGDAEKLMKDILKKTTAKQVIGLLQKTYGTNSSDDLWAA